MATEHSQCFSRTAVVSPVVYRETVVCVEQQPGVKVTSLLVSRSCPHFCPSQDPADEGSGIEKWRKTRNSQDQDPLSAPWQELVFPNPLLPVGPMGRKEARLYRAILVQMRLPWAARTVPQDAPGGQTSV